MKNPLAENIHQEVKYMIRSYFKDLMRAQFRGKDVILK